MSGPVLYSTNPWFARDVAERYRDGTFFAWVCECYDPSTADAGSITSHIAPSSSPMNIYEALYREVKSEEQNSSHIRRYKKTFKRLATEWRTDGSMTPEAQTEMVAALRQTSWRIWRPVLYVIPREPLERAGRIHHVARPSRAGHGAEMQVKDLETSDFDIIELRQW